MAGLSLPALSHRPLLLGKRGWNEEEGEQVRAEEGTLSWRPGRRELLPKEGKET